MSVISRLRHVRHIGRMYARDRSAAVFGCSMPCYSPLKGFKDLETGGITFKRGSRAGAEMEVACGQCLGCRLDRARVWAVRIIHESGLHEMDHGNSFITLTYRSKDECTREQLRDGLHVPDDWSLQKSHYQKFLKRLRKHFPQKIRYYLVAEYGSVCQHKVSVDDCDYCNVGRPHYHAILFNCSFDDLEVISITDDFTLYTSETLEKIWKYGLVSVGEVNYKTAGYVARYCQKKITGKAAEEHYMLLDEDGVITWVEPEFARMSLKPGIGAKWYERYKDEIFPADETCIPGEGVFKGTPRYYETLLERERPEVLEEVKRLRQVFRSEHGEEYTPERLMAKYRVKKAQVDKLKRTLE